MRGVTKIISTILIILLTFFIVSCGNRENRSDNLETNTEIQTNVQESTSGEVLIEEVMINKEIFTWEEFEALLPAEQMEFQNSFTSTEAFDEWLKKVKKDNMKIPWENGGKHPQDYTWEEFEKLTPENQMKFQYSFGSIEEFDKWLRKAQGNSGVVQWDNNIENIEYTWEEFEVLTPEEQMKFQNSFGSIKAFDEWLQKVQRNDDAVRWDNNDVENVEYTWEEFEKLAPEDQMKFQNSFESIEKFDEWLQKAQKEV